MLWSQTHRLKAEIRHNYLKFVNEEKLHDESVHCCILAAAGFQQL